MITTTSDLQQFYTELLKDPMLQERLKVATTPENLCELAAELGKERGYAFHPEGGVSCPASRTGVLLGRKGLKSQNSPI